MRELPRVTLGKRREVGAVRVIAAEQHGVVARQQLLAAGMDGSAIDRALRSGGLHRFHRGIYATLAPELLGEDGCLLGALMAAGKRALLSHGTAAWRWRIIPAPPSVIEIALPRERTEIDGLRLFISGRYRAGDTTHNGRFPTTTVPRTLLDLAARYDGRACCARSPKPSFNTTCARPTWSARCAAGTRAVPTCAPHCAGTRPATAR
jgi:hypothetical protein